MTHFGEPQQTSASVRMNGALTSRTESPASGRASAVLTTESAYVCAIVCQKCCVYTPGHLNIHASRYDFASKHLCAQYACECEVSAYCVCAFMHVPEKR